MTSSSLTGPQGYAQARNEAPTTNTTTNTNSSPSPMLSFVRTVEDRPYFPLLKVDPTNEASVIEVAGVILSSYNNNASADADASAGSGDNDDTPFDNDAVEGKVTVITGGLTNALFKVDLTSNNNTANATDTTTTTTSVLVRIFGAEGMIDRDEDTTNFARLCHKSSSSAAAAAVAVVHSQLDLLGRFNNGRVETWIPNMRQAHHVRDFGREGLALEVSRQLARLHYGFDASYYSNDVVATTTIIAKKKKALAAAVGGGATNNNSNDEQLLHQLQQQQQQQQQPSLWKVIESWIDELSQHLSHEKFQEQTDLMELFSRAAIAATPTSRRSIDGTAATTVNNNNVTIREYLSEEMAWLKNRAETEFPQAPIVFCHNDVNAANILLNIGIGIDKYENNKRENNNNNDNDTKKSNNPYNRESVCIIDYEYGSINYAMYDVANFICEHCGGNDNGIPDYELLPSSERLIKFLEEYVKERDEILSSMKSSSNSNDDEAAGGVTTTTAMTTKAMTTVSNLHSQVELFQMASNLYWGIWGILQAAGEVIDGTFRMEGAMSRLEGDSELDTWDNLRYGMNRLERYRVCKEGV